VNTYITIPARYLAGRKLRTVLTTLAIVFGVAVVFAVNMLLPGFTGALEASQLGVTGQADMTVTNATGGPFSQNVLGTVAQTNGVAAAAPVFQQTVSLPSGSIASFDAIGLDPTRAETVRFYRMTDGRFLNGDDKQAAVVSYHLAQALGLHVGDTYKMPTPQGQVDVNIVGTFNTQGTDQMLLPLSTAQQLFSAPGQITSIDVAKVASANRDTVEQALQEKLGSGYHVGSPVTSNALAQDLQLGLVFFNIFGILTLFMGAFLIFNTFRTVVVERRHDIGMLRAVGATRGTITRLILVESALQGIVGTAIGLVLGFLLGYALTVAFQSVLDQFIRTRLEVVVPPEAFVLAIVLGIGMTLLAGLLPAINAGRVPVLAALRQEQVEPARRRASIGAIVGGALIVLGIAGLFTGNSSIATLGGVLILVGLVMVTSLLINPIARVLDPVVRRVFSSEGQLAEGNLQRNPSRASITISALTIALAVIVSLFATLTSIENAYVDRLNKSTGADILLLPPNIVTWNSDVGVGKDFEQKLAQVPGVGDISGLSYAPSKVKSLDIQMLGLDPTTYPTVSGLTFDKGDGTYTQLNNGRTAFMNGILATALGVQPGDEVPVQTPNGVQNYKIEAIGTDYLGSKTDTIYTSKQNLANDFNVTDDIMLMANLQKGADSAAAKAGVQNLLQQYPQLTLNWGADWRKSTQDLLDQLFLGLYIALAALMIPSVLGLINTLAINVLERTREIGVLRAIGTTRGQIRRMIVAESLLLGVAGTVLGLLSGLALGYALTGAVGSSFYKVAFSVPVGPIIFAVVVALLMTLLASVLPARQAARVKIVQALQYE
jgi:putative ABC transport system permease protein